MPRFQDNERRCSAHLECISDATCFESSLTTAAPALTGWINAGNAGRSDTADCASATTERNYLGMPARRKPDGRLRRCLSRRRTESTPGLPGGVTPPIAPAPPCGDCPDTPFQQASPQRGEAGVPLTPGATRPSHSRPVATSASKPSGIMDGRDLRRPVRPRARQQRPHGHRDFRAGPKADRGHRRRRIAWRAEKLESPNWAADVSFSDSDNKRDAHPYPELGVHYAFDRPNNGEKLTGDLRTFISSPWVGSVRSGARMQLPGNALVGASVGYLSFAQNGLDVWEGKLRLSVGF